MSFYDFEINKPSGQKLELSNLKGDVILVVNTATKCGLTPQSKGLETLHKKYNGEGLSIIGFPCSQFLNQEPETNETIEKVCEANHGVTFQLTEKIDVNGKDAHPIFNYLKSKKGGILGSRIKWNFTKFLISKEGVVLERFSPTTTPEQIESKIIRALKK